MESRKKFIHEIDALNSIASAVDLILELTYDQLQKKQAAADSPYYTAKEAAARLKIDRRTLRRRVKDGSIAAIRSKRKPLFLKTDIDHVIATKELHTGDADETVKNG